MAAISNEDVSFKINACKKFLTLINMSLNFSRKKKLLFKINF